MSKSISRLLVGVVVACAVGAVSWSVGAQQATRLFGTKTADLASGTSTPITCTQSGSGCFLDVTIAGGSAGFADGTSGAPSIAFASEPTLGFYRSSAGNIVATGTLSATASIGAGGNVSAGSNGAFSWAGVTKSGIRSSADGVIELQNVAGTDFTRLNFGGTTSAFPALKRNGALLQFRLADDSGFAALTASTVNLSTALAGTNPLIFVAAPTISSGFGTSPSIVVSNGPSSFRVNVGTGGVATSGVVGLPTAATGWNCVVQDMTNNTATRQTASTTTSATFTAAAAWAASDILVATCFAY